MLIQNASNSPLPALPPDRPASDGASVSGVVDTAATADIKPIAAAAQPAAAQAAEPKPTSVELKNMVDSINRTLSQSSSKGLEFSIDQDTSRTVVKLVDTATGDVIRQFPSDEMLGISKTIGQFQERLQQAALAKEPPPSAPSLLVKQRA